MFRPFAAYDLPDERAHRDACALARLRATIAAEAFDDAAPDDAETTAILRALAAERPR